ncbi:MAG TPA: DUF1559 domain-containing protein [Pirellulales bacterium]|nr:DUF1559 domain-containing protein [Pirellulales bacterium]
MRIHRPKRRVGFTLVELLVVIAIIGVLIALLLPAVQQAREAARRSQCQNNLKQQALAVANYASAFGTLPSSVRPPTGARIAWLTQVLPYLDQQGLFDKYDQTQNWSAAIPNTAGGFTVPNSVVSSTRIAALECPSSNPSTADPSRLDDDPDPKSQTAALEKGFYGSNAGLPTASGVWPNGGSAAPGRFAAPSDYAAVTHVEAILQQLPYEQAGVGTPAGATTETQTQIAYAATVLGGSGASAIDGYGYGILQKNAKPRLAEVRDGLSNTVLLSESAGRPWLWNRGTAGKLTLVNNTDSDIGGQGDIGTIQHDRVNGGGWSRPASDISLVGSDLTGTYFPGYYVNRTNGVSVGGGTWTASPDQITGPNAPPSKSVSNVIQANLASGITPSTSAYQGASSGSLLSIFNGWDPAASATAVNGSGQPFSFHPGGLHVALGDGSVKFISENIPIRLFARLVTRDQDEPVDGSYYEPFSPH